MTLISDKENLKREIGVRSLALSIVNMTVGTGIFILPALVAENLAAAAIVAYLVCGMLMFLVALCFAEVGSKVTTSGGTYAYIEKAFGPYSGFIANILFIVSCFLADAAIANGLVETLKHLFPVFNNELFRIIFFILLFGTLIFINIRSVKYGIMFVEFATYGKLIPLILLVVIGAGFVSFENLKWTIEPTLNNIGAASLLLFFAFMGIETPVTNSGEIKNSKRTVPLGIFLGITSVLILYISIQLVTQGVLGDTLLLHKDSPLSAVAGIVFGKTGITLLLIVSTISMLGSLGGATLGSSRALYAGARNGIMPKDFAKVHPRFFTPYIAVAFYSSLGLFFAIAGGFKQLAIISGAATLIIYLGVVLATLKLRFTSSENTEKTFKIPGGIIVPLLAIGVIIWLLSHLTQPEYTGMFIFLVILSIIYFAIEMIKKKAK